MRHVPDYMLAGRWIIEYTGNQFVTLYEWWMIIINKLWCIFIYFVLRPKKIYSSVLSKPSRIRLGYTVTRETHSRVRKSRRIGVNRWCFLLMNLQVIEWKRNFDIRIEFNLDNKTRLNTILSFLTATILVLASFALIFFDA